MARHAVDEVATSDTTKIKRRSTHEGGADENLTLRHQELNVPARLRQVDTKWSNETETRKIDPYSHRLDDLPAGDS